MAYGALNNLANHFSRTGWADVLAMTPYQIMSIDHLWRCIEDATHHESAGQVNVPFLKASSRMFE